MELYGLDEQDILKQIDSEYSYGYDHISNKREIRREDLKLYVRESKEDRIDIHSIYTTIQTLLAINYMNEIAVKFSKRKNGDEERAENANICAEYDYGEMNLDVKDYVWEINRLLFGCGIQVAGDFDFISICPRIENINTLSYIFDPKGGPTIEDHRFFGIETEMTRTEMKKAGFQNYMDVGDGGQQTIETNETRTNEARGDAYITDSIDNKYYPVYIAGTIINGKKYIAITGNSNSLILEFKYLAPIYEEEKLDESKIFFPIALKYFSYLPGDSMGITPFDLLRSKQSAYSILFNLMLKMAYKNAMGGDRLVNTKKITDLSGLAVPTLEGKDIPVDVETNEDINNIVSYIQKDTPTSLPQELKVWLQEETILDSGIDRNTQGVLAQGSNTLGEREMAQKNANLRFLLGSKQAMWGEKFRWRYLYQRQYAANLKSIDKKEFVLETGYSSDFHAFTKDDFVGSDSLHIKLVSKAQEQQELDKMKLDRLAIAPQLIMDAQNAGEVWKVLILQRNRMLDIGESKQRVMQVYPYSVDELNAMDKFKILKLAIGIKDKVKQDEVAKEGLRVNSIDEEHNTFLEYYQTLPDSEIKRKAIANRYEAIKNKKMYMEQQQAMVQIEQAPQQGQGTSTNSAANVSTAMAQSQALGGQKTKVSSLGDIAQ